MEGEVVEEEMVGDELDREKVEDDEDDDDDVNDGADDYEYN